MAAETTSCTQGEEGLGREHKHREQREISATRKLTLCITGINQILPAKGESCWQLLKKQPLILVSSEVTKRILLPWGSIYIT